MTTTITDVRPTRRSVTRAAAWSVPVIAVATAAPAYAASPCDPRTGAVLDWDGAATTYTRTSNVASVATFDPDGNGPVPALQLDVTAAYEGNMRSGYESGATPNPSLRVTAPIGGLGASGISLWQATTSATGQGRNDRGAYTFTFSRPVSNLDFTITDIDSQSGDFWDVLQLSAGYTVVSQPSTLTSDNNGIGGAQRFYATGNSAPVDNATGTGGNLRVRYSGPISTFTITYWNGASTFGDNIDTDQTVYVSDLTFDYKPC